MNDEKRLHGMLAAQHKEGRAEGLKEGIAEGRAEGRAELLKNLLESGLPIEEVSRLTKIEVQEIMRLVEKNK